MISGSSDGYLTVKDIRDAIAHLPDDAEVVFGSCEHGEVRSIQNAGTKSASDRVRLMREPPAIIKAINALKAASSDDPITRIPFISAEMADRLVAKGYANRTPWSKDPEVGCYRLTKAAWDALEEKAEPKPKLTTLKPRLATLPSRLKTLDEK